MEDTLSSSSSQVQAVMLGHTVRKRLVEGVRKEYEQIVAEVECDGAVMGSLSWPSRRTLCYPCFTSEQAHQQAPADTCTHQPAADLAKLSRQELLELRSQLSMELLWTQQAIASRQKYLLLKKELSKNLELKQ